MAVNSKKKGNSFELAISKILSEHFNEKFTRVPQSGAITGGANRARTEDLREDAKEILSGDLITPKGHPISYEIKAYADEPKFHQVLLGESKKLDEWIEQSDADAKFSGNKAPVIIFKINRKGTFVAFDMHQKDMEHDGKPFMYYKGKSILSLDNFLSALGDSYYKKNNDEQQKSLPKTTSQETP